MFSPDATLHGSASSRGGNPRRRQRRDSTDSARQAAPQRKRSKLSEETFAAPANGGIVEGGAGNGGPVVMMNGHAGGTTPRYEGSPGPGVDLSGAAAMLDVPMREKKGTPGAKRSSKGDGTTLLSKTGSYAVKLLPGMPEELRRSPSENYRASSITTRPYAVAFTHKQALVWDYTSPIFNPSTTYLDLPQPSKPTNVLPLGALVCTGPSAELGLVHILPTEGKITYWENLESAQSHHLFQERTESVNGDVGGVLSGETIVDLIEAGHAGYIALFSTGRLAQILLRDQQGRPSITTRILRSDGFDGPRGILSGFKSIFSTGWKKDIAGVVTRPSATKGQMEVLAATNSGVIQAWDIGWQGHQTFKGQADCQEDLLNPFRTIPAPENKSHHQEQLKVLDVALLPDRAPHDNTLRLSTARSVVRLLLLLSISGPGTLRYGLAEIDISGSKAQVGRVVHLHVVSDLHLTSAPQNATLLVPSPGHTAFVVLQHMVAIVSVIDRADSPDTQLLTDSGRHLEPYQDAIYFKDDEEVSFAGWGPELPKAKSDQSSCVIFTRGCGAVRILANRPSEDERVTAKSKMEQAIFFGSIPGNVLDFSRRPAIEFSQEEVEDAAWKLSCEIRDSRSDFVPKIMVSMDQHIQFRMNALLSLAAHVRRFYPPMSRATKWEMMFIAERLNAAAGVWKAYDTENQNRNPNDPAQRTLLDELIMMMTKKENPDVEIGEVDAVRHWFARSIRHMDWLVPWSINAIKEILHHKGKDYRLLLPLISQGCDMMIAIMENAYAFRYEHKDTFGLQDEPVQQDGVLAYYAFEGLPEPWTCNYNVVKAFNTGTGISRAIVLEPANLTPEDAEAWDPATDPVLRNVVEDSARMLKIFCRVTVERYYWLVAQPDNTKKRAADDLANEFIRHQRYVHTMGMLEMGMFDQACEVAEKYKDMRLLVDIFMNQRTWVMREKAQAEQGQFGSAVVQSVEVQKCLDNLSRRLKRYFTDFGEEWSAAFYRKHVRSNALGSLLEMSSVDQEGVTRFLRSNAQLARTAWVNEVLVEHDFGAAADCLTRVASQQETNLWCEKVELSVAKLANLAAAKHRLMRPSDADARCAGGNGAWPSEPARRKLHARLGRELGLASLQERVFLHIRPVMMTAIDEDARVPVVMNAFGQERAAAGQGRLEELLRQGVAELCNQSVMSTWSLVDLLTLIDQRPSRGEAPAARARRGRKTWDGKGKTGAGAAGAGAEDICGKEFYLALEALRMSGEDAEMTRDLMLRLVWKRCFVKDDWQAINETQRKTDGSVGESLRATVLYETVRAVVEGGVLEDKSNYTVRFLSPEEVVGAGSSQKDIRVRFPAEDLSSEIVKDNMVDDARLQHYTAKCQLHHWWQHTIELARKDKESDRERESEETKTMAHMLGVGEKKVGRMVNGTRPARPARGASVVVAAAATAAAEAAERGGRPSADKDVEMEM
ncbi:Non-repetitive/WGA-negative nucleoporin C-terminal-domain-containing protein [Lineolata rhizophorae]|uniref:Non-repetitive/WGA-negative nucleoporin C-terminal-domain-containing protein n=1 Tax=Lineolata rhizophorae TaxID=578093 RepID=A0A6A6PC91_9PEZI|nr:Non-repetitive/WGA-negative nucleoporin C-terminal-domain-containing protein [Lineolata rhizophorae]